MTDALASACRLAIDRDAGADPLTVVVVVVTTGDGLTGDCELMMPSNTDDVDDAIDKDVACCCESANEADEDNDLNVLRACSLFDPDFSTDGSTKSPTAHCAHQHNKNYSRYFRLSCW